MSKHNTNLVRYNENNLELYVNNITGECFASIRGISRMVEKPVMTVSNFVNKRCTENNVFGQILELKVLTEGGLQGVRLLNEDQMCEVIYKYRPSLMKKFMKLGLRKFIHQVTGYRIVDTIPEPALIGEYEKKIKYLEYKVSDAEATANRMRSYAENADRCATEYQEEMQMVRKMWSKALDELNELKRPIRTREFIKNSRRELKQRIKH